MSDIRRLSSEEIDQIAAGEVVERPASVAKELIENALDAGATRIRVDIEGGGIERLAVIDDGRGMSDAAATLALERHTTSKLPERGGTESIAALRTFGFRGEALASIAAVSKLTLTTRARGAGAGVMLSAGQPAAPAGCAEGTQVEVRSLFHNVPARRKFLRSPGAEASAVIDACTQVALARPNVRFELVRDQKGARRLEAVEDRAARAGQAFPKTELTHFACDLQDADQGRLGRIEAMLAPPESARSGTRALYLYVNGRFVRDRMLARAVAFAYGSVLPPGRYPVGVVHLDIDPGRVDVNVHPQKLEVRFERARGLCDTITKSLAFELGKARFSPPKSQRSFASYAPPAFREEASSVTVAAPSLMSAGVKSASVPPAGQLTSGFAPRLAPAVDSAGDPAGDPAAEVAGNPAAGLPPQPALALEPPSANRERRYAFGSLRVVGQVRNTFIVCEGPEGLIVLDQHAVDERIRYHHLQGFRRGVKLKAQGLLMPELVTLSESEIADALELEEVLSNLGFVFSQVDATTLALTAAPQLARPAEVVSLFGDVLAEVRYAGERAFGDRIDTVLATMACHAAIRAGDKLTHEECVVLLQRLDACEPFAGHCPHGRPVVYEVPFGTLERAVGR